MPDDILSFKCQTFTTFFFIDFLYHKRLCRTYMTLFKPTTTYFIGTFLYVEIKEDLHNFKNGCHIWSSRIKNTPCSNFWIIFWRFLTLFDTPMIRYHQAWIINEDLANFKNGCHIWSSRSKNTSCSDFWRILTLFDTPMTRCHQACIINEDLVNFKNECHIWSSRPKNTPYLDFWRPRRWWPLVFYLIRYVSVFRE